MCSALHWTDQYRRAAKLRDANQYVYQHAPGEQEGWGLKSSMLHVTHPLITPPLIEAGLKRFSISMSDRFTRVEVPRFIGRNQACIKDRCNEAF